MVIIVLCDRLCYSYWLRKVQHIVKTRKIVFEGFLLGISRTLKFMRLGIEGRIYISKAAVFEIYLLSLFEEVSTFV